MKLKHSLARIALLLLFSFSVFPALADKGADPVPPRVTFEPNAGQVSPDAAFLGRGPGLRLLFSADGATVLPVDAAADPGAARLTFVGSNPTPTLEPTGTLPGTIHYLTGDQPDRWITHVPTHSGLRYRQLYPGIEAEYLGHGAGFLLRFHLAPGSDPDDIVLQWSAAEQVRIEGAGDLLVRASGKDVGLQNPHIFQQVDDAIIDVSGRFSATTDGSLGFVVGDYDAERPLVIETTWLPPVPSSIGSSRGSVLATDNSGHILVAGRSGVDAFVTRLDADGATILSTTYFGESAGELPLALAAADDGELIVAGQAGSDAFIGRLAADGSHWIYSRVIGGTGNDAINGVALDAASNTWVVGTTDSPDFPVDETAFQTELAGGSDFFVARLSADGSEEEHLGFFGSEWDDTAAAIVVGPNGRLYVAGAESFAADDVDGIVTRLRSDDGAPEFVTRIGGSADDAATALAMTADSGLLVSGWTDSLDLPVTDNATQERSGGHRDGFLVRIGADDTVQHVTYLGGAGNDQANGVAIDPDGGIWVAGTTDSDQLPGSQGRARPGGLDGFLLHLDATDMGVARATLIGESGDDRVEQLVLDRFGDPVVSGSTAYRGASSLYSLESTLDRGDVFVTRPPDRELLAAGCPGTVNFDNDSGNLAWGTATNWDGDVLPTTTDDVCIDGYAVTYGNLTTEVLSLTIANAGSLSISAGTLTLTTASHIDGTVTHSGGTITGAGDLTVTGLYAWSAGTMSGSGELNPQGGLALTGASGKYLSRTLNNTATTTATYTNNSLYLSAGGTFHNMVGATFDSAIDIYVNFGGGTPSFINDGTFIKSGGTGTTSMSSAIAFANDGIVDVQSGTLQLNRGATHTGTFDFTGATLRFSGGTHNLPATETVTGTDAVIAAGTVNFAGGYDVTGTTTVSATANFTGSITDMGVISLTGGTLNLSNTEGLITQTTFGMTGGTLTGTSDFTVTGAMTWSAGTMSGSGALNPQGGLALTGASGKYLSRTLNNTATTTATYTNNSLYLSAGGTFHNMVGATFDSAIDIYVNFGGGTPSFINDGTFIKSGGTGTTSMSSAIAFANDGVIDVQTGTLQLNRGATHTGTFDFTGARLRFSGGTHNLPASETLTGTDAVIAAGTVNFAGGYDITGTTTVSATANFTGSITDMGVISLTSGTLNLSNTEGLVTQTTFDMTGGTLTGTSDFTVTGAMTWSSGTVSGSGELNPQGGLAITGASGKYLSRTLNNTATTTATPTNNSFYLSTDGAFHNMVGGTFDSQNNAYFNFGGGTPSFINEGTFIKSAGTGTTQFASNIVFTNNGIVDVQSGTFQLTRGATHTGVFDCTGATLRFNGGTQNLSAAQTLTGTHVIIGSGTVNLPGGYNIVGTTTVTGSATANFTGSITSIGTIDLNTGTLNLSNTEGLVTQPIFDMAGGTLTGTSDFTVTGAMTWSAGTLSGSGVVNAQGGLSISGATTKWLARTLNNTATTTANPTNNSFYLATGGTFHNMVGGTFDSTSDMYFNWGGGSALFINDGSLIKSAGAGTTSSQASIVFTNTGSVDALSGTLYLRNFTQTAGTTTLNGGDFQSNSSLPFDGGLLTGVGTVTMPTVGEDGLVAPGLAGIGVMAVSGAYTQSAAGTLQVELSGVGCTDSDRLDATGAVNLDGTLDVTLINGCMPVPGQSFTLITGSSVAGTFPNFTPPATDCPVDWNIVINPGSVVLEVVSGTCLDGDGDTFSDCCGTCTPDVGDSCTDCDDADPLTYPGATELCDGTDNNCDTTVPSNEIDDDGDLYVECVGWNDTQGDAPTILGGGDCDDTDILSYPGALELCDGNDNDCDTSIPLDEIDNDSDLYVECSGWNDTQGDQAAILGGADCDDTDIVSYPGAAEQCDGNDNNCDASIPGDELDLDSDLYTECSGWNDTQGDQPSILGGADCDDSDSTSFPGATELCDGNDNNCDASVPLDEIDNDSDLYVECMAWNDTQGDQGAILGGADCDDGDSASFPGAAELCDGNDNNCDATIPLDEIDNDSDLYVECSGWNDTQGDQGAILGGGDCDDTDVVSYPGAAELCDGNDNNCDASVPLDEIDNDADLYVECSGWNDTQGDQGAILGGADCDDTDIVSYPGAAELCDGNDNNCDASVPLDEIDNDADLYVECSGWSDTQGDQGAILGGADCDDTDIVSYPGAAELCDGNDNNCDASVPLDEIDNDADLYVECSVWSDTQGDQGTILGGADCDDTDIASYPGAAELCDGNDNNCDTTVPADELDGDSDLYVSCSGWNDSQGDQPAILGGADCNNSDSSSYPGASEVCDGNDNNCDTIVPTDELDSDSDLYVACSTWADSQGDQPAILGGADCNNADGTSFPGATEVCDGNDNDCDTIVPANELDGDLDLFVACAIWSDTQGDQPSILGGADCDPADMISFPGALEICDGNDNSCSGTADDGDADSDTVLVCDDCDDGNFDVNALPSESQNLLFVDPTTMQWSAPAMLGGTSVNYDVLRTDAADDFVTLPVCVESDDGSDTQAVDANVPASGAVFFYLSRPLNACGDGSPGADSDAIERAAATCP